MYFLGARGYIHEKQGCMKDDDSHYFIEESLITVKTFLIKKHFERMKSIFKKKDQMKILIELEQMVNYYY